MCSRSGVAKPIFPVPLFFQFFRIIKTYTGPSVHRHCTCSWTCNKWWWRHQMETFSAVLAICVGNSPVPGEFPAQRPVTRSFDVFFDLHPNKRLSKQWWGWWFETLSRPLWHHCNVVPGHHRYVDFFLIVWLSWFQMRFHFSEFITTSQKKAWHIKGLSQLMFV